MTSLDSCQCPLSAHIDYLYIITHCKLLNALEANNKEMFLIEELSPHEL